MERPEEFDQRQDQSPIGVFVDRNQAETAINALREANFPMEQISLMPQSPPVPKTEAWDSGAKGAILGTVIGGLIGLLLSSLSSSVVVTSDVDVLVHTLGIVAIASGAGAASIGIIAAMSGVNVRRDTNEAADAAPYYLVVAKDIPSDRLSQAKDLLQQLGSQAV
ncbi:hypothetical protein [Pantanalinema sp. GBBB05]|uniref:hypothetical protein n=1 Tax=Pantanalinema sp. GBBB05 TaxID=2604139 RepID=UPI001D85BF70|nr:hypothetical protein [Pantanalinema sp. GBBB05]